MGYPLPPPGGSVPRPPNEMQFPDTAPPPHGLEVDWKLPAFATPPVIVHPAVAAASVRQTVIEPPLPDRLKREGSPVDAPEKPPQSGMLKLPTSAPPESMSHLTAPDWSPHL